MSNSVDQRVVQMQFDNSQFERETQTSMNTIGKLEEKLSSLTKTSDNVSEIKMDSSTSSMNAFGQAVSTVSQKFSALEAVAFGFMSNIGSMISSKVVSFAKSLSVDQITAGWTKYAQKTTSVQTIMSATAKDFDDTGEQMEYVNSQLEKLNWFTDETSYNYTDMVDNIGKFTNNNVPLDKAVTSMQGIATWAAASGANASQASRAMYNLSQSLGMGSVRLQDWMSIENAQMATVEFKETVMEAAVACGTLEKDADGAFKTVGKGSEVTVENFRNTLSEGWFTSDVLTNTLQQYGGFSDKLNAAYEETGLTTSRILSSLEEYENGTLDMDSLLDKTSTSAERLNEIFAELGSDEYDLGKKAFKAAQEAKTFSDAINATADAVSTGWMNTFEIIFGDYQEAKILWTDLAEALYDVFATSGEVRNEMLEGWKEMGGRTVLLDAFWNTWEAVGKIITPIKEAFREIFPETTAKDLMKITNRIDQFSLKLLKSDGIVGDIKRTFKGAFALLDIGVTGFKSLLKALKPVGDIFKTVGKNILGMTGDFGDYLVGLSESIKENQFFDRSFQAIAKVLTLVSGALESFFGLLRGNSESSGGLIEGIGNKFQSLKKSAGNALTSIGLKLGLIGQEASGIWQGALYKKDVLSVITEFASKIPGILSSAFSKIGEVFSNFDFGGFTDLLSSGILTSIFLGISNFVNNLSSPIDSFSGLIDALKDGASNLTGFLDNISSTLADMQTKVKAEAIRSIAISIAILAGSLVVLSFVDEDKLTSALTGLLGIMGLMLGFTAALSKMSATLQGAKSLKAVSGPLIKLAAAILILSIALKTIGKLSIAEVGKGLLGVGALLGMILAFAVLCKNVSIKARSSLKAISKNLMKIAVAMILLTVPVKILGQMDTGELIQGMIGLGAMLLAVGVFMKALDGVKTKGSGGSMILIAASMLIFVSAIKSLGQDLSPGELEQGIVSMGLVMGILALYLVATGYAKHVGASAGAMLAASVAILILTSAIKSIAAIEDPNAAYRAVLVIAATLTALALAMLALGAIKGKGSSAASLTLMIASLLMLIPIFTTLGNLSLKQIGKTFLVIAGAIAVLGIAAALLTPVIPAMLGLAAALALFGVGIAALGAGLVLISVGITGLATAVSTSAVVIVAGITSFVVALIEALPTIVSALADALIAMLSAIAGVLPRVVNAGLQIILALLVGIYQNIGGIVAAVGLIIAEILNGLAECLPDIVAAGMNLVVALINGIADAIRDSGGDILAAISNLISALIEFMFSALQRVSTLIFGDSATGTAINQWLEQAKTDVRETLAPESMKEIGDEAATGIADGMEQGAEDVASAADTVEEAVNSSTPLINTESMGDFVAAVQAYSTEAAGAASDVSESGAEGAGSNTDSYRSAGEYAGTGFTQGLLAQAASAYDAGYEVGKNGADGIADALDEQSPSKLTKKYGRYGGEGFVIGLRGMAGEAYSAGEHVGDMSASGIASAIQKISDSIQNGVDTDPVIRPVLDLSDIEQKSSAMNSIFGRTQALRAQGGFNINLSKKFNSSGSAAGSADLNSSNGGVVFNQYNTSPKALSRLEIYRQTKNQIAFIGRVTRE